MIISVDDYFTNGEKIKKCEDYALAENDKFPFAIVTDGCSSSTETDIGSKVLAHAAKVALTNTKMPELVAPYFEKFYDAIGYSSIITASTVKDYLKLDKTSLDSTLLIVFLEKKEDFSVNTNEVHVMFYGDGFLLISDDEGLHTLIYKNYKRNAPYYLSYLLDKERNIQYQHYFENTDSTEVELVTWVRSCLDSFKRYESYNEPTFFTLNLPISKNYSVCVSSDGLDSFFNSTTCEKISYIDIAKELSHFKTFKGEFIKRRVRKGLDDLLKNNIYNTDDISMAGISIINED